jgi:hypothetical protein
MGMSGKLLRPAGRFTPKSISGLAAWWDADSTSSLTLDGSGNVSQWNDLSGNGVHATQGTANNRPTPIPAGLNGRQVVTFDGSNDGMAFTGTARTDETVMVVARVSYVAGAANQIVGDASSGFGLNITTRVGIDSPLQAYCGGFSNGTTAIRYGYPFGVAIGPDVMSLVRSSASGGQLLTNGTSRGTCTTSNSFALARIGVIGTTTQPLNGYIAEVCIYSRALTASERQSVERYLGTKWGITVA